jgi:hypothetical protein
MKARTLAIARGELQPKADDPKVWFTSPERFARLLSNRNRALLAQIADTHPASLHELAASTARTSSSRLWRLDRRSGRRHRAASSTASRRCAAGADRSACASASRRREPAEQRLDGVSPPSRPVGEVKKP